MKWSTLDKDIWSNELSTRLVQLCSCSSIWIPSQKTFAHMSGYYTVYTMHLYMAVWMFATDLTSSESDNGGEYRISEITLHEAFSLTSCILSHAIARCCKILLHIGSPIEGLGQKIEIYHTSLVFKCATANNSSYVLAPKNGARSFKIQDLISAH